MHKFVYILQTFPPDLPTYDTYKIYSSWMLASFHPLTQSHSPLATFGFSVHFTTSSPSPLSTHIAPCSDHRLLPAAVSLFLIPVSFFSLKTSPKVSFENNAPNVSRSPNDRDLAKVREGSGTRTNNFLIRCSSSWLFDAAVAALNTSSNQFWHASGVLA